MNQFKKWGKGLHKYFFKEDVHAYEKVLYITNQQGNGNQTIRCQPHLLS